MKIIKSGFYRSEELENKQIYIGDNLEVTIFDDINSLEKIEIGENSKLNYFSYFSGYPFFYEKKGEKLTDYNKCFKTTGKGAEILANTLIFAKNIDLKTKLSGEIASNKSKIDINIVSLASFKSFIDLDGQIQINKGLKEVEGYLVEDNIFIGNEAKIRGLPTLLVRSDDVKANHACRIEKINDEKLFYLRSRGIGRNNALNMMIESYIVKIFGNLKKIDNVFYEKILEHILRKLGEKS